MAIARSIIAVLLGYVVFAGSAVFLFQITGHRPHAIASYSFEIETVVYGMFFAVIAGWLTAWIAIAGPIKHGIFLSGVIAAGAVISLLFSNASATWSQWSVLLFMAPMPIVGSYLRARQGRSSLASSSSD